MPTITKWSLSYRLFTPAKVWDWQDSDGKRHRGKLRSIHTEDPSGSYFRLVLDVVDNSNALGIHEETIYIRTYD